MEWEPQIFKAGAVLLLFLLFFLLWLVKRNAQMKIQGENPEVLYQDAKPSQVYFSRLLTLTRILLIGLIAAHGAGVKDIPGFYPMFELSFISALALGLGVGLAGLGICLIAQRTMGLAWRVGIDEQKETPLIQNGIFSLVRNPTYSGIFTIIIAVILLFPTLSILVWGIIFFLAIEFQVRLEEEFLLKTHGETYQTYAKKVKRYIPGIY